GDGLPLPEGDVEIQPSGASLVQSDQQQLGGEAVAVVSRVAGLRAGHQDGDGPAGGGAAQSRAISNEDQGVGPRDARSEASTPSHLSPVELHDQASNEEPDFARIALVKPHNQTAELLLDSA